MKKNVVVMAALAIALTAVLSGFSFAAFAAEPGFSIEGNLLITDIGPGQTYVHTITITNSTALDMQVEAAGLGQNLNGATVALSPQEDSSSFSARSFISNIDKTSLHLEPNISQKINVTLKVPSDAAPGEKYAVVYLHSIASGQGVGVIVGSNIPVILTIPGSTFIQKGQITDLNVPAAAPGKPIKVETTFKNTGNFRFQAKNQVTITDQSGAVLAQSSGSLATPSIVPPFSRLFSVTPDFSGSTPGLSPGQYFAESKVMLDDGTVLDARKISFIISENSQAAAEASPLPPFVSNNSIAQASQSQPSISPVKPEVTPGVSWALAGGIIGAILIVGLLLIFFIMRLQSKKKSSGSSPE